MEWTNKQDWITQEGWREYNVKKSRLGTNSKRVQKSKNTAIASDGSKYSSIKDDRRKAK